MLSARDLRGARWDGFHSFPNSITRLSVVRHRSNGSTETLGHYDSWILLGRV